MIDLSTDEGIRQAFREIAEWPATVHADSTVTMIRTGGARRFESARPDRGRGLAVAAAIVLLVAGVVGLIASRDGNQPVADSPRGWSNMAESPLSETFAPSVVWTGDEMLVWGGYDAGGTPIRDGAAYRPSTNTWRSIAPITTDRAATASGPLAEPDLSAWVGDRALSIVPSGGSEPWGWDIVSYDPADDIWRTIEQNRYDQLPTDELVPVAGTAPIHQPFAAASWNGEFVVVGWRSDLGTMGWARLDPVAATWSSFNPITGSDDAYGIRHAPGSPAIIDDRYLVLLTSGQITDYPVGYRIDLDTGTSIALEPPPQIDAFSLSSSLADDGTIVGVGTDQSGRSTRFATRLDAATGTFTPLAAPRSGPVAEQASLFALPDGYALLGGLDVEGTTMGGLRSESVHLAAGPTVERWTNLPKPPIDLGRVGHTAIWTGDEIIVWGGATIEFGGPNNLATIALRDGALYRP